MVPGTRAPLASSLVLVTSTVFMHVVMPMVRYDWAAPPATPPRVAATAGASPRLLDAKYDTSEDVKIKIAPLVVASITACLRQFAHALEVSHLVHTHGRRPWYEPLITPRASMALAASLNVAFRFADT